MFTGLGHHQTGVGDDYVHSAVDDHSRLAYSEICGGERAPTAAGFWTRASALFAARGIVVQRVLTDNAFVYRRSLRFRSAVRESGAMQRFTQPWRPQTNGKVERFNRTLLKEWAYDRTRASDGVTRNGRSGDQNIARISLNRVDFEKRSRTPAFLLLYNHHRAHTGLGDARTRADLERTHTSWKPCFQWAARPVEGARSSGECAPSSNGTKRR